MGSRTALIHRKRGFTCLWLVGGGVFQTEQAGRETCALTFWHKEDVEDPCGARALLVSVVITMTESLKITHSVLNHSETFFTKQERPPSLKKAGSKFTGSWGAAIFSLLLLLLTFNVRC